MTDKTRKLSQGQVRRAAQTLKQKPGWDPQRALSRQQAQAREQLEHALSTERNQKVYTKSDECPDCHRDRQALADPTVLCETHMNEAMGLG